MNRLADNPIPVLISDLGTLTERRLTAMLAARDISTGEYRLLRILAQRGPMTPSEVIPHSTLEQPL